MPYTPGPWDTDSICGKDAYDDPDTPIVYLVKPKSKDDRGYYWMPNLVSIPAALQQVSDAKLMAAAPLMLDTLKATLEQLQSVDYFMGELISDATVQRIKTAIEEAQYDWDK